MTTAAKIKVPSFHFYSYSQYDSLTYKGEKLEAYLKKAPEPHVFLVGGNTASIKDYEHRSEQVRVEEDKRVWSELLKFLAQHLTAPK